MAAIDGILSILISQGGDELRLVTGEAPILRTRGVSKRLSLPPTDAEMVALLLAPMLTPERTTKLDGGQRVEAVHVRDPGGETFRVAIARKGGAADGAIEASFTLDAGKGAPLTEERAEPPARALPQAAPAPRIALVTDEDSPPREPAPAGPVLGLVAQPRRIVIPAQLSVGAHLGALFDEARSLRASDLHLAEGSVPAVRVDGRLRKLEVPQTGSLTALLDGIPAEALRLAASGERAFDGVLEHGMARFRINVFRTAQGLAAAVRLLPRRAPRLADLGLPPSVGELAMLPHGLVLVCGPTGSGKSATLAALAQIAVERRGALLVSLEDPVEFLVEPGSGEGLARQRQVGRDVPSFAAGLRDALREDPDVILVGELRDPETIALALGAAETGHLLLATLHSPSAPAAIDRVVDGAGAERRDEVRTQLAGALRAVVAQRLLPRAHGVGRVVAVEILRANSNVSALVRDGKTAQIASAIQSGRKEGMVQLEAALAELVHEGQVARAAAETAANDPVALAGYLDRGRTH